VLRAKDPWRDDPEGEVGRLESVLLRLPDVLAHLDPERLAQDVTEAAVELTGADFGACARVADPAPWLTVVGGGPVTLAQGPDPQRAPLLSASLAGAPVLRVDDLSRWAPTEEAARLYGTFADGRMVRSYLAAPVTSRSGAVLGAVFLGHHQPRAFDERDERLVGGMSALLAVALDTAGLFQERERVATALQESLLPPLLPTVPGVDLAARYRATGAGNLVGGDFYDVFQTGEGDWAVVLGDVSGSGPEAAALTGLARYTRPGGGPPGAGAQRRAALAQLRPGSPAGRRPVLHGGVPAAAGGGRRRRRHRRPGRPPAPDGAPRRRARRGPRPLARYAPRPVPRRRRERAGPAAGAG